MKQGNKVRMEIIDPNRPGTVAQILRKIILEKLNKA